jgi:hypothetical protein
MSCLVSYSTSRHVTSLHWPFTVVLLILFFCSTTPSVMATTKTWTNNISNLEWGTANNWDPSGMPDGTQTACFTNLGLNSGDTVYLGVDRTLIGLLLDTQTDFTIGGGFTADMQSLPADFSGSGTTRSRARNADHDVDRPGDGNSVLEIIAADWLRPLLPV